MADKCRVRAKFNALDLSPFDRNALIVLLYIMFIRLYNVRTVHLIGIVGFIFIFIFFTNALIFLKDASKQNKHK